MIGRLNLAANYYILNQWPRRARKKETNLETKIETKKGAPTKRMTIDLRSEHARKNEMKKTRSEALKCVEETWFEGCGMWNVDWEVRERKRHKKHEAFKKRELQQEKRAVGAHLHWMLPKQLVIRRDGEKIYDVNDVAGYHCCQA